MNEDRARAYLKRLSEVPGYFSELDAELFISCCSTQESLGTQGDLLEIGVWYGRSAILTGYLKNNQEQLHVNDLFGQLPTTDSGKKELEQAGPIQLPTVADFLANYHRFHDSDPSIHPGPSTALTGALKDHSFRFIHIDGSHTQEAVEHDINLAKDLLKEEGIVVFDDFANFNHIGVAAALWPALAKKKFVPFASSPSKLYAAVNSEQAEKYRNGLELLANRRDINCQVQIANHSNVLTLQKKFSRSKWLASKIKKLHPFG